MLAGKSCHHCDSKQLCPNDEEEKKRCTNQFLPQFFLPAGLSVTLGTLRTDVDARLETRGKLADLFASQIGKDIMELMNDVNVLREEIAVSHYHLSTFSYLVEKVTTYTKLFGFSPES